MDGSKVQIEEACNNQVAEPRNPEVRDVPTDITAGLSPQIFYCRDSSAVLSPVLSAAFSASLPTTVAPVQGTCTPKLSGIT